MADAYTVAAVANRYGVSAHTVLAWIDRGELQAVNVARSARGKRPSWRITAAALEEFERRRIAAPVTETEPRPRNRRRQDVPEYYATR